jgi:hypothetical protein
MNMRQWFTAAALGALVMSPSYGCSREEPVPPAAETQTESPTRVTNQPMTVTGCLRAGEAADTFVLTSGGTDVATYNLVGREGTNLADHVGRQVEVNGTMVAQQETTTRARGAAGREAPTGTAGAPSVSTRAEVDIRQLEVNSVRPTGGDCR